MSAQEDEWAEFERLKAIMEDEKRDKGLLAITGNMDAEVAFWKESMLAQHVSSMGGGRENLDAMRPDRYNYWERVSMFHTCTRGCGFKHLRKGFQFRMPDNRVYMASGYVYVCNRTLKPHYCGPEMCDHQEIRTDSSCTVCSLTGLSILENQQMSMARSREDPDVRTAGNFTYEKHFSSGHEDLKDNSVEGLAQMLQRYTNNRKDLARCMKMSQEGASEERVLKLAKDRASWREIARAVYEEQVLTSGHVHHQLKAVRDAHKTYMENVTRYVRKCAKEERRVDLVHVLMLFNRYVKPAYKGVYFGDVDLVKRELYSVVVEQMLDVWERFSECPYVKQENLTFQMCARGILVIMAGHDVDHRNGMKVYLKIDRESRKPERITEHSGVRAVDLKKYEISEFQIIPRVDGLMVAPATIVNQENNSRKRKQRSRSSRFVIASNNTRSRRGGSSSRKTTNNEGRFPSVKRVNEIVASIVRTARTAQDIERYCHS